MNCPKCETTLIKDILCNLYNTCPRCGHAYLDDIRYKRLKRRFPKYRRKYPDNRVDFRGNPIIIYRGGLCNGK